MGTEQNPQSARRNNFSGEQISQWFLLLSANLSASNYPGAAQTGPRHGFHQCGIKLTGSDTVSPYISTHDLYMLGTSFCLYAALLLVELMLTTTSRLNSAPAERMLWPCLLWAPRYPATPQGQFTSTPPGVSV